MEAKNQAEALLHSSEKSLADFGDKVSAEDKAAIETAIADLKSAKEGDDAEAISTKSQTLIQASMKLGEAMYKAQAAEGADAEHDGGPTKDDGVVDAEFEEVHDDKKSA